MKRDGEYLTAESSKDFSGWELLEVEDFKPGRKLWRFRLMYCDDKKVCF